MAIKEELEEWRASNEGISFAEWRNRRKPIEEDNTIEEQHNTSSSITANNKEPVFQKKKGWKDYRVKKDLYLSKWVYEKLKNEESISDKVNKILLDYFSKGQEEQQE